jgi:hypothetical protein
MQRKFDKKRALTINPLTGGIMVSISFMLKITFQNLSSTC